MCGICTDASARSAPDGSDGGRLRRSGRGGAPHRRMDGGTDMSELTLTLDGRQARVRVETAIVAGWTGRDRAVVEKHIAELEALGVPRPSKAPVFYRVSTSRLTTAPEIESTAASSGEVEALLL